MKKLDFAELGAATKARKDINYQELGRKGGEMTFAKYGREHYERIGRKGGLAKHAKA